MYAQSRVRKFVAQYLESRVLLSGIHHEDMELDSAAQAAADWYASHLDPATGAFALIEEKQSAPNSVRRAGGDAGANLALIEVYMADKDGNRVDTPAVGTNAFMFARFSTTDLPAGASYTIRMTVGGVNRTTNSSSGAGLSGTRTYNVLLGDWIITTGFKSASIGLDSTGAISETSEIDNTGIASFTPPVYAPKFSQPLQGTAGVDFTIENYSDMVLNPGVASDYLGGPYQYDGHDAWDIVAANFGSTDGGYDIYAASAGIVTIAHDGEFDRNIDTLGQHANYIAIDHGGGWMTYYYHLRRDSVAVSVGDIVTRGQLIGLMGSSGNSSEAHLHWSVYYNGMRVEPMVAESSYMVTPLGYSDLTKNVMTSGIHHHGFLSGDDYKERQSEENVFHPGDDVQIWASVAGVRDTGYVTMEVRGPTGTLIGVASGNDQIHQDFYHPLPTNAALGTYNVRWLIDGVVKSTDAFSVISTTALRPAEHYLRHQPGPSSSFLNYVADNRWTPIDAGIRYHTYDNRPADTWDLKFIANDLGDQTLTTSGLTVPSGFGIVDSLAASIPNADALTLRLNDSASLGRKVGYVSYNTNDADVNESTMRFRIEGTVASANPLTTFVPHTNDTVFIRRSGSDTYVWINTPTTDPATIVMPVSATSGWLIGTGDGDDTITLDYTGGNPLADYAILAPGDSEEDTGDQLVIIGTIGADDIKLYGTQVFVGTSDVRFAGFEAVSVNSGSGADTITLSGSSSTADLDLNTQAYTLSGGIGTDLLLIDDTDDASNATYALRTSSFNRDGNFGLLNSFSGFESIELDASDGNNSIELAASSNTTIAFVVLGGIGNDSLSNGSSDLSLFDGLITYNGGAGTDSLVVDDYTSNTAHDYVVESTNITRTDAGGYSYSSVEQLTILGGTGADTFTMNSSVSGFSPFFFGNDGVDTFEIQGMFSNVTATINSGAGNDILRVNADDTGTARVRLESAEQFGGVTIGEGGTLTLAPAAEANALRATGITVDPTGELNVTDNPVIIDYIVSPIVAFENDLRSGYNGGAWNGKGIRSSTAAATPGRTLGIASSTQVPASVLTALGGGIDTTSLIIRYTLTGDIDLNRAVNFDDLLTLSQSYGLTGRSYARGNLDYSADGLVGFDDLLKLAQAYGTSMTTAERPSSRLRRTGNAGTLI